MNPPPTLDQPPLIHTGPFLRALIPSLILWGAWVGVASFSHQPGVICLTPMAWLLALWSGGQYVRLSAGRPSRSQLAGPALLGAALGLLVGILFIFVTALALPAATPEDVQKTLVLDAVIVLAGVGVCAGFSTITAWLTLRRLARQGEPLGAGKRP